MIITDFSTILGYTKVRWNTKGVDLTEVTADELYETQTRYIPGSVKVYVEGGVMLFPNATNGFAEENTPGGDPKSVRLDNPYDWKFLIVYYHEDPDNP